MRRFVVALGLLAGVACASGGEGPTDAGVDRDGGPSRDAGFAVSSTASFSVMSWNIEQFPKSSMTPTEVEDILDDLRPDLVGLQELLDQRAFFELVDQLDEYDGTLVFEDRLAVGMIWRPDRVRVENIEPLFTDDDYAFPRAPLRADVTVLSPTGETEFDFVFINLHLKAQGDARSQYRRLDAIEKLATYIEEEIEAGSDPDFVVIGDYNDRLTDERGNNVFLRMLDKPELYNFLTLGPSLAGEKSYIPIPGFIDHIMVTTDAVEEYGLGRTEAVAIEERRPDYVSKVSDHRPVRAFFALPAVR